MVFSYLLSMIRKGLSSFQRNNGKVIIPGDDDDGCDPVEHIETLSWWTRGTSSFSARQNKKKSLNANLLTLQQHDAGVETPQLSKDDDSNTAIGRMNIEEMGVDLILTPELGNPPVIITNEKTKVYEEAIKDEVAPPPLYQDERKLPQLQGEAALALHDNGTPIQPLTAHDSPEITSEHEMVSSVSISCNNEPSTTINENSKGYLELDERNEPYGCNQEDVDCAPPSSPISGENDNKTQSAAGIVFVSDSDNGMDTFLNDSDDDCFDLDCGGMEKGIKGSLKKKEIENEERDSNSGGNPGKLLQNLVTDGYESFSSYSCDAESEKQQSQLNSATDSKLSDHCDSVEIESDSNDEDESECMQDTDVYNWITTDKESIQCTGSWYKDLEESPKLEENLSSVASPSSQQRSSISPEGSKLGFVSSKPVSQSHCQPVLSPLRFPTSDSGCTSPPLLSLQSAVPCVKETCDVSRKMASLPQQEKLSHPQVSTYDLYTSELI